MWHNTESGRALNLSMPVPLSWPNFRRAIVVSDKLTSLVVTNYVVCVCLWVFFISLLVLCYVVVLVNYEALDV
jgi:hypothetical protein